MSGPMSPRAKSTAEAAINNLRIDTSHCCTARPKPVQPNNTPNPWQLSILATYKASQTSLSICQVYIRRRAARFEFFSKLLGAVIGLMLWMWISATVILLGAELKSEIEHQTATDSTTGAPKPLGLRGATMADTVGQAVT